MHVRKLDHVAMRVSDLARSRAFYEQLLGFGLAPRPDLGLPGVWYGIAGAQVHLIESAPFGEGIDPTGPHFAVEVESLAAAKQELDRRGITYLMLGDGQLWLRDPDGNVVELREPSGPG